MLFSWWLMSPILMVGMVSACFNHVCDKKDRGLNSFLWTVQRSPPAYLFGTIHVPYDRVWDWIPDNAKLAFTDTDSAVFELDLTNPYTLTELAQCQMLPSGQTLSDHLPGDLYGRLQQHLDYVRTSMPGWMSPEQHKKGLFADYLFNAITGNWRRKRPIWVMLMVNSLTESDVRSRGIPVLDLYLAQHAKRDRKVTGGVERVEEQCVPLNKLNLSQVVFALNQTLSRHEQFRAVKSKAPCASDALIHHYNCGDLNSLMFNRDTTKVPALVNSSLPPEDLHKALSIEEYFQQELIDKRNARMAERVAYLLQEYPNTSFFFAFGAGHFLGNETVIDRLRKAGVDVVYTQPGDKITRTHRARHGQPQKSRKFVLSDDFLQPSDVIYGDIQYLFSKRYRHDKRYRKERRKMLRAKKRQEQLDSLWENLDPSRFSTKKQPKSGTTSKRKQRTGDRNTFNDLWVRTDQIGPRHLEQKFIQGGGTHIHNNNNDKDERRYTEQEMEPEVSSRQDTMGNGSDKSHTASLTTATPLASVCMTVIFTLRAMMSSALI